MTGTAAAVCTGRWDRHREGLTDCVGGPRRSYEILPGTLVKMTYIFQTLKLLWSKHLLGNNKGPQQLIL